MNNLYLYHPKEISFCGYSGSGKTTLISSIIDKLNSKYRIGYIKHDAHSFQMDKPGKDTYKARKSGADTIFISNDSEYALLGNGSIKDEAIKIVFQDFDFIIVEGHKKIPLPKILMLDKQEDIPSLFESINTERVLGFCGRENDISHKVLEFFPKGYDHLKSLPYFQRDDLENISKFILQKIHLQDLKTNPNFNQNIKS